MTDIHIHTHAHKHTYIHIYIYIYICIYVYINIYIPATLQVSKTTLYSYIYMYVIIYRTCVCACIRMYVYVCTHAQVETCDVRACAYTGQLGQYVVRFFWGVGVPQISRASGLMSSMVGNSIAGRRPSAAGQLPPAQPAEGRGMRVLIVKAFAYLLVSRLLSSFFPGASRRLPPAGPTGRAAAGRRTPGAGRWVPDAGRQTPDAGRRTPEAGR